MPTQESEFGRRLRAARGFGHKDRPGVAVNQKELAAEAGLHRLTVAAYERGETPKQATRDGMIQAIHRLTGLPPEFFKVNFTELHKAIEANPVLALDWAEREFGEDCGDLSDYYRMP